MRRRQTSSSGRRGLRAGYTLIEMIVSMSAASVLMAGMGSAVFLSSQAFNATETPAARRVDAAQVQKQILDDLRYASSFSERSASAVTFVVPDRTGDGLPDTLRYAWTGAGNPLTFALNGGTAQTLIPSVENFSLNFQTQTLNAPVIPDAGSAATILFVSAGSVVTVQPTFLEQLLGVEAKSYVETTSTEKLRISRLEAAGYTVVPITTSATSTEITQALSEADALYVSGEVDGFSLTPLYFNTTLGVVTECRNALYPFGFCKAVGAELGASMFVKTPPHYITSNLAAGQTTFLTSSEKLIRTGPPFSPDLQGLLTIPSFDPLPAMLALNANARHVDGARIIPNRRVQLPFGFDSFDPNKLNEDGWQLMLRSVDWVLGNGDDGVPNLEPPTRNFGYETLFSQNLTRDREQVATQAFLGIGGVLQSISVFVGGSNGEVRVAIYSDVFGEPNALIAESAVMKSVDQGSWLQFEMTDINLPPGMYWLAVSMDNGNHYFKRGSVFNGRNRTITHRATADGFRQTWGVSEGVFNGSAISIYATVKPN